MNKKTMAGTALGISLLGAASTAPISTGSFLGGLVHHIHKARLAAAHLLRDDYCRIISGMEHQPI